MGPNNVALTRFYEKDKALRDAEGRLANATRDVRLGGQRVAAAEAELAAGRHKAIELAAKAQASELDVKARAEHIDMLRQRQLNTTEDKAWKALLADINIHKTDKAKAEEAALAAMELAEQQKAQSAALGERLDGERQRLATMQANVEERVRAIQAEVDELRGPRDELAAQIAPDRMAIYKRLAEKYDGEALAPLNKPDARREEYVCEGCYVDQVVDVYNRLHSRDDLVRCTSCGRILFIPADLPPEVAVSREQEKPKRAPRASSATSTAAPKRDKSKDPEPAKAPKRVVKKVKPEVSMDPATLEMHRIFSKAAGESARNAIAAGNDPLTLEVYLDGRPFAHTYKGQSVENFRRAAVYFMGEHGIVRTLDVYEKGQGPLSKKDVTTDAVVAGEAVMTDVVETPAVDDVPVVAVAHSAAPEGAVTPTGDPVEGEPTPSVADESGSVAERE